MKQKIRSYLVFTSLGYRIIMFAVLPLLLLGIQVFTAVRFQSTAIPVFVMALVLVEVVADNWFLGGIQEKGSQKIDYLKTSPKGMKVMQNALVMDLVRRLVFYVVFFGLCQLITMCSLSTLGCSSTLGSSSTLGQAGSVPEGAAGMAGFRGVLLAVLITYALSVLGIFISRFTSYIWVYMLCGYVGAIIGLLILLVCSVGLVPAVLVDIAMAVLGAGFSFLTVKIAMLRVEGSYYDK